MWCPFLSSWFHQRTSPTIGEYPDIDDAAGDGRLRQIGLHLGSAPVALIYLPPEACFGHAGMPERPKGADCKSAGNAFGGSNPSPSTNA